MNDTDRPRVLIIDDEVEAASLLAMHFERDGYQVSIAHSGPEGLRLAHEQKPSAVILDIRMPGMDGYEVCGRLRDISDAAILFVTVVKEGDAIVRGLQMGADDYLIKPFDYPVLLARMEACLRRRSISRARAAGLTGLSAPWALDPERREVVHGEKRVQLTPKEFDVLQFFMENPDKVLAADHILTHLWGPEYVGDPDLVKQFVYRLRTKLEPDPPEPQYFVTVRGSGYAFEPDTRPDLRRVSAKAAASPASSSAPTPRGEGVKELVRKVRRWALWRK